MRILYLTTVFEKVEFTSTIYADLMRALSQSHSVTVVALGACTEKRIQDGYPVYTQKAMPYYNTSLMKKGMASLFLSSYFIRTMKKLPDSSFDVILFETPPPTIWRAVSFAKKKFGCPAYLMLKDIAPQNGVDLGMYSKHSLVYHFFSHAEKKLYRTADFIGCMSEANVSCAAARGANPERLEIFQNTMEVGEKKPRGDGAIRHRYHIPENAVVCICGGNMGRPQALPFLTDAIVALKDDSRFFFVLAGRGKEKEQTRLAKEKYHLQNVLIFDALPQQEYDELLSVSDIGLVLLDPRFTVPNYPSRILKYMQYSLPIVAATDDATDLGTMIEKQQIGLWGSSSDLSGFISHLTLLAENPEIRTQMGANGFRYVSEELSVSKSVELLEGLFDVQARAESFGMLMQNALLGTPVSLSLGKYGMHLLYATAVRHKTEALLYPSVAPFLKDDLKGTWESAMQKTVIRQINMQAQARKTLLALHEADIFIIALKGLVALPLYPHPELRYMGDADLLIDEKDMDKIDHVLQSLGYRMTVHEGHEYVYNQGVLDLDIHTEPFGNPKYNRIRSYLTKDTCTFDSAVGAYVPPPTVSLLYMIAHGAKTFLSKGLGLKYICDIVLMVQKQDIDWEMLWRGLSDMELLDFGICLLHLCEKKLGITKNIPYPQAPKSTLSDRLFMDCFSSWAGAPKSLVQFYAGAALSQGFTPKKPEPFLRRLFSLRPADRAYAKKHPALIPVLWLVHLFCAAKERLFRLTHKKEIHAHTARRTMLAKNLKL